MNRYAFIKNNIVENIIILDDQNNFILNNDEELIYIEDNQNVNKGYIYYDNGFFNPEDQKPQIEKTSNHKDFTLCRGRLCKCKISFPYKNLPRRFAYFAFVLEGEGSFYDQNNNLFLNVSAGNLYNVEDKCRKDVFLDIKNENGGLWMSFNPTDVNKKYTANLYVKDEIIIGPENNNYIIPIDGSILINDSEFKINDCRVLDKDVQFNIKLLDAKHYLHVIEC